jgi:hypothetical protein
LSLQRLFEPLSPYWLEADVRKADLNEAARAADASREANVAVYGEWLK